MISKPLLTVFVSSLMALSVSADFFPGACPKIELQADFDLNKYLGTWYEDLRPAQFFWERKSECNTAQYVAQEDGTV